MRLLPQYIHVLNPKLKHIYLSFSEEGDLIVKSPKVSLQKIEQLLLKKASWIEKSRAKLQLRKGKSLDFLKDPKIYFMGKPYPLILSFHDKKRCHLAFDGLQFTLFYYMYDEILFQKHVDHFYKIETQKYLPSRVNEWAKVMNLTPLNIRFRKTKRQWGSCSGKNVLSFNTMIMKLPQDVIQYIIVHELAHIRHKHHQKSFWEEVEAYLPEYKTQVQELKNYMT